MERVFMLNEVGYVCPQNKEVIAQSYQRCAFLPARGATEEKRQRFLNAGTAIVMTCITRCKSIKGVSLAAHPTFPDRVCLSRCEDAKCRALRRKHVPR